MKTESKNPSAGFIENKGQIIDQNNNPNPGVLYLLNTPGMNVLLRRFGFSYDAYRISNIEQSASKSGRNSRSFDRNTSIKSQASIVEFHRIDINLIGLNPDYTIESGPPSTDYLNYYTTGTPPEGITFVRSYGNVTYKNIYPGIDLEFISGNDGYFEYTFALQPGADLNSIKLKVQGPEKIKKFHDGLSYCTNIGEIDESMPVCYYRINDLQVPVKGRFKRVTDDVYGFSIDKAIPAGAILVIDPIPTRRWGTYFGWTGGAAPGGACIDENNNCVFSGETYSVSNIATAGVYQGTYWGGGDVLLEQFSPDGARLWGTYFGGSLYDEGNDCGIDPNNNIVVVGRTESINNIASPGAYQSVLRGTMDGFMAKFTSTGQRIWSTYYGGNEPNMKWDDLESCGIDQDGNIYSSGNTSAPDYISSPGAHQEVFGGWSDDYLLKFSSTGQRIWGTYYGGSIGEGNSHCTVSKNGFIYLSGNTNSLNNIATPGSFLPTFSGTEKTFLAAFDPDGVRHWGTYYAGENGEWNYGCTADTGSNVYIYGSTTSYNNISTPGAFQQTMISFSAYMAKFDSSGQRIWGTYFGEGDTKICGAAVDDSGYVYITGNTTTQDTVYATIGAFQPYLRGDHDAFFAKLNTTGTERIWGTYYGGTAFEEGFRCMVDNDHNLYLSGWTFSENNSNYNISLCNRVPGYNYISTPGSFEPERMGLFDIFLVKFSDCYMPDTATQINGPIQVCANSSGISYTIDPIFASTGYHWCVSNNLTITSGQNSTAITVDVGPVIGTDTISVYGINSCDNGYPKSLLITVEPRPVPVIAGTDTICTGDTAVFCSTGGMINYLWAVSPGGTVVSGGTPADTTISVTWSTGGYQWVSLNFSSNGCQSLLPTQKAVWVIAGPAVSVTITPTANPICPGTTVTFTAVPLNEGTLPLYQWKVNGISVGTNNTIYSYTPVNWDVVQCILTSNLACASGNPAASNSVTMVVNPILPVSISISASSNPVCAGTSVTFTATPANGGTLPSYQWEVNGINVGSNSANYSFIPLNGDVVSCVLTSNATCLTGNPATGNPVTMTVNPNLVVSVSISPSSNPFCPGGPVTFTATPVNEGLTPQYQWKVNGINVGINSLTYTYNPANGDQVTCVLNSPISCPVTNPVTSNMVTMIQNNSLPAGITIAASQNPFCPGSSVTFTATPINGGTNSSWQWKVNGTNAGTNSQIFTYNPIDGDSVRCVMNSNLPCVTNNPVSSMKIIMSGNLAPVVTFTSCFDTITTIGAKPFRLKGGIPLGGTYSGPGVNGMTGIFTPSVAGTGLKTISYTYTNVSSCSAGKSKTILVQPNPAFTCGNNLTDIRDNQVYPTVQIGSQCWFASDLKYGVMISSTQNQRDNCLPERYLNSTSFYQWDELMLYNDTQGLQGLCPPGWHVPTEGDWNILFANWAGNGFAGAPLKYSGYSGFNAMLSGVSHQNVQWDFQNFAVSFWSSTPHGTYKAWAHGMNDNNPSVSFYPSLRSNAFSVRCLDD